MNDEKCMAKRNMWGYPLRSCGAGMILGPVDAHRIVGSGAETICARSEQSRKNCGHHESIYDEFDAWVKEERDKHGMSSNP